MHDLPQDRFTNIKLTPGSFWHSWREVGRRVSAPTQLDLLKSTGRYKAFDLQWQDIYADAEDSWPIPRHLFWESDVGKFVEAACYFLQDEEDAVLRQAVDHLVNLIESAQQPDGYINIHFVVVQPTKRWTNIRDMHELYNAGHLIEGSVAHYALTKSMQFVNVMLRFVHYCAQLFIPQGGSLHGGYPGHPEIELALLKLYRITNDETCLNLSSYFIHQRGFNSGEYYKHEQARRGEHPQLVPAHFRNANYYGYMQAQAPIVEQTVIKGHAVRAMYLLTGVADLCTIQQDDRSMVDLQRAVWRLWHDCCTTQTYVTGGIGSVPDWEGFGVQNVLPADREEGGAYNETCASIGQLMLCDRLEALGGLNGGVREGVADVMERVLFNASITTGMSIDGKAFTYDNRLASSSDDLCMRHEWFDCACCPPNVLRTLGILPGYFWFRTKDGEYAVRHFFDGTLFDDYGKPIATLQTEYPWSGVIKVDVQVASLYVRIPAWSVQDATLTSTAWVRKTVKHIQKDGLLVHNGYIRLAKGQHEIDLCIKPRILYSHPRTHRDTLTVAFGPLIYCLEDLDNPFEENHFKSLTMDEHCALQARKSDEHGGIIVVEAKQAGQQLHIQTERERQLGLEEPVSVREQKLDLLFVPYYYRANRKGGKGQMRCSIIRKSV